MAKHAFLSASSSDRWLHCPPSAKLCAQEEDPGSPYAQEGSDAHALCQYELEKALGRESKDPRPDLTFYNEEMQEGADGYVAFVMEQLAAIRETCPDPAVLVEQTLDFSKFLPGFLTKRLQPYDSFRSRACPCRTLAASTLLPGTGFIHLPLHSRTIFSFSIEKRRFRLHLLHRVSPSKFPLKLPISSPQTEQ